MESLDDIKLKINKYIKYNSKLKIYYLKKNNKSHYIVIDGYFRYKVYLLPTIKCQCGQTLCNHILYILFNELHLSYLSVMYLFNIGSLYDVFIKHFNHDQLNFILEEEINRTLSADMCGICLNRLNDNKHQYDLDQCSICKKFTHKSCLSEWKKKTTTCIYCGL